MSRFHVMIVVLFVAGAATIYLSFERAPASRNQAVSPFSPQLNSSPNEIQRVAALYDANGTLSAGEASWRFADGLYQFGLNAGKLPQPPKGAFYAAWFVYNNAPSFTGKLEKIETGPYQGNYLLGSASKENLSGFEKVMVTLETKDDDQPEKLILEGDFKN